MSEWIFRADQGNPNQKVRIIDQRLTRRVKAVMSRLCSFWKFLEDPLASPLGGTTLNITFPFTIIDRHDLIMRDFIPFQKAAFASFRDGGEVSGLGAEMSFSAGRISPGAARTVISDWFDSKMKVSRS
jgi:hypothetical protein